MIDVTEYALAFMTGLFGTAHCIGMCSGLVGASFIHSRKTLRSRFISYHGTRILVYVGIGLLGAFLGRVLEQSGIFGKGQGILMICAGILVIVMGIEALRQSGKGCRDTEAAPRRPWHNAIIGGAVNGLIPCSLVFSVAIKAAVAEPLGAGLLMLSFGLGTLPGAVPVSLAAYFSRGGGALRLRIGAACVIALGVKTTYEGVVFFDIMRGLAN